MDKRFLGILAAIIIIFIGIFAISQHSSNKSTNSSGASGAQPTNHVEGQNKAGVTFVEYGDYECPICEAYYQPLKQAVAPLLDQIHFQFRNLPLTSIHPNAFAGARAAEAAALQGKFWQMHDKLYENQNAWVSSSSPIDLFSQYAQQIGLNVGQFKADYASSKVNDSINADLAAFAKTGQQQGTPAFFLDGKYLANTNLIDANGAPSVDKIQAAIKAEINSKTKS
ncbi:MAG TPA: thioredoxin domain-containing protein [Candidatus Saccharimonadales bacterium]|nr:thioredoxin domain-containing protein [Candidatus Saccharimonadales bacterium]